jgi:alcohol dehydrogenase (cytochrome c)
MKKTASGLLTALACALLAGTSSARAADVTYERLLNPDKEPQNWLMHHRDLGSQRHSPLEVLNKTNAKNLKLLFAVPLGGKSANESIEATPLVEDGFMYMVDSWGIVYKIDVRSGTAGKIVWKMDPKIERQDRNRGAALWGNLVISVTGYDTRVIATDKETGQIVWQKNVLDQADLELTAAPLALKDTIIIGGSGGDRGLRNWVAALDAKTGEMRWKTYSVPAPGEPGSETWKDKSNAYLTGGGAFYGTGSYDPVANLTYWGSGNPVPGYDSSYRPGDNLFTNSAIAFDASNGKIMWWHQYTPNDNMDYDEIGSHILIDTKVNGEDRKLLAHPGRNGFTYSFDRDVQIYAMGPETLADKARREICPSQAGGTNFWASSYSRKTGSLYIPAHEGCGMLTVDTASHVKGNFAGGTTGVAGPITGSVTMVDAATGELKKRADFPYANSSGVLTTAGGLVVTGLLDGSVVVLDDQTLEELWRFNVGTGFNAAPMTYSVNGKQYIAIASGVCCSRGGRSTNSLGTVSRTPDLRNQSNATVLYVFGL